MDKLPAQAPPIGSAILIQPNNTEVSDILILMSLYSYILYIAGVEHNLQVVIQVRYHEEGNKFYSQGLGGA